MRGAHTGEGGEALKSIKGLGGAASPGMQGGARARLGNLADATGRYQSRQQRSVSRPSGAHEVANPGRGKRLELKEREADAPPPPPLSRLLTGVAAPRVPE